MAPIFKVLWLGPLERHDSLIEWLKSRGHLVRQLQEPLNSEHPDLLWADWVVSYGYRHILKPAVLDQLKNRIINLHISFLPWNRGADPNLWSFLEDTVKGVSIHYMDAGIDTGDILAQRVVVFETETTLRSTYERLSQEIEALFKELWPRIEENTHSSFPQAGQGSCHRLRDKIPYENLLKEGWDTPIENLTGKAQLACTKG